MKVLKGWKNIIAQAFSANRHIVYLFCCGMLFCSRLAVAQTDPPATVPPRPLEPLEYRFPRPSDNPFSHSPQGGGLFLQQPSNLTREVVYDPATNQFVFKERVGDLPINLPFSMDMPEFMQHNLEQQKRQNWNESSKNARAGGTQGSTGFMPQFSFGGEAFDRIFGTDVISIVPQGSAELTFGMNRTRTENPNLSENARKNTIFNFDTKLQVNVAGTIGDKMRLGISYNTESMFEFENQANLVYEGKEDEIIQRIEAGNVTLPLPGSLITGSQSLFGLKTELQFGNLTVTAVASQQKGQTQTMEVRGGAQINEFEIRGDEYDANRHFFLSQAFRENYENALRTIPVITSGITITRIEVWVTNRTNTTTGNRNLVAFMDLGEMNDHIYNRDINFVSNVTALPSFLYPGNPLTALPDNDTVANFNSVYKNVHTIVRDFSSTINSHLIGIGLEPGVDFERLDRARLLTEREYTLNPTLGYISLNSALNADEVLAVAYEYTYGGKTYRVGELSRDGIAGEKGIVTKMLKGTRLSPTYPTWKLMMKNIYAIFALNIERKDFQMDVLYADDRSGNDLNYIPDAGRLSRENLLSMMGLDRVNSQMDAFPDGVFDFIEGITINPANGRIIFPVLEPFGATLSNFFDRKGAEIGMTADSINMLKERFVFQSLYDSTLTKAREYAEFNKFVMRGRFSSASGSEIRLNAMNIPQGSVVVTMGGVRLVENVDYTVDYLMGSVRITNQGLLESGTPIKISMESQALFAIQQKTMLGTHLNYRFTDNFNIGATVLRLTERPMTQKVNIGYEPLANTMLGFNTNYNTELPALTTFIDKLPLIQTKAPSSLSFTGEFAQLIPGVSKAIMNRGSAYIDDFEASKSRYDLRSVVAWNLASIPHHNGLFPESTINATDPLDPTLLQIGMNRARLAWYTIDPLFVSRQYMNSQVTPDYIRNNPERWTSSNFVRTIFEEELFPNRQHVTGMPTNIQVLNVAYYPTERGPYNYDAGGTSTSAGVYADGSLRDPRSRWGGMMRQVNPSDFESNNIQYIEFWLMDPFVENLADGRGADLYFNLGNVSEDILKDGRKSAEQGLPVDGDLSMVDSTAWGYVPKIQAIVHSFDQNNRRNQDVGFDGMHSERERRYFDSYLTELQGIVTAEAFAEAWQDPSTDDYFHARDPNRWRGQIDILTRYKDNNGTEGNSSNSDLSNTTLPDEEDINRDNTMSETESYYQYRVSVRPGELEVGKNFIVDKVEGRGYTTEGSSNIPKADWYLFRIPINEGQAVGGIQDFKSIRFMRMFLTDCPDSLILRFARLELVRGEWREYNQSFLPATAGTTTPQTTQATFEIASVNIEENAGKTPVPYMVPPGFDRAVDQSTREMQMLNEQSMLLRVRNMANGDARAVYRNVNYDMRRYSTLRMELHAAQTGFPDPTLFPLENDEMSVFIRIGTDYRNNFYEYEIPLKLTPWGLGTYRASDVWPEENRMVVDLDFLPHLKQLRDDDMRRSGSTTSFSTVFEYDDGDGRRYTVCGNPNLANIRVVMIGIRYPQRAELANHSTGIEVWVNELRLSDVSKQGGWAANARLALRLADLATIAISGESMQPGFGGVESNVNDRLTETRNSYDIAANIELGKLFPEEWRVQIPLYLGLSESFVTPEFDPLNPDVKMRDALNAMDSKEERDAHKALTQDYMQRKSMNLTNVRVNTQHEKPRPWNFSNFTFNYAYYETFRRNVTTEKDLEKSYSGGIIYDYSMRPLNITPLQNVGFLNNAAFRIIRDFNFNPKPNRISIRTDMVRTYNEIQRRNIENPALRQNAMVDKNWIWRRNLDIQWDLARSLRFDFTAGNQARIDEPVGVVDRHMKDEYELWRDSVWTNIRNGGRLTDYRHSFNINYTLPINKLPLLDWVSSTASYRGEYMWNVAPIFADDSFNPGNNIQNRNTITLTGTLNFASLYNKVPYFRTLTQPQRREEPERQMRTVTFTRASLNMRAGEPRNVSHGLGTTDIEVKLMDANGNPVDADVDIINENRINITTETDVPRASIEVTGQVERRMNNPLVFIANNTARIILGVKNFSVQYQQTGSTMLPGYAMNSNMFGMQNSAPGLPFMLGWQDTEYAQKAADNGWLVQEERLNAAVAMTHTTSLNARSTFEPFQGMRIQLSAMRSFTENRSSFFIWDPGDNNGVGGYNPEYRSLRMQGNYSISVIAIRSSFEKIDASNNYRSETFEKFKENRSIIARRHAEELQGINPSYIAQHDGRGGYDGFNLESQDVMIKTFYATYTGKDPEKVSLSDFPEWWNMLPLWEVNFDGLSNLPAVRKHFRSVSLRHSYRATYQVGSYISNFDFNADDATVLSIARDLQNNFIPRNDIASVNITEAFSPLLGVDLNFLNSLSARFEYRKGRNITLGLGNLQMTENHNTDYTIGLGYVFNEVSFVIRTLDGDRRQLQSDLRVNTDFSIRDSKTLIRRVGEIEEEGQAQNMLPVQASSGQNVATLKISADYKISNNFTLTVFFDRIVNTPFTSMSFKNYNTNFGFSMRFMLLQ